MGTPELIRNSDKQVGGDPNTHLPPGRMTKKQKNVMGVLVRYGFASLQVIVQCTGMSYSGVQKTVNLLKLRGDVRWCRWHDADNDATRSGPIPATHLVCLSERGLARCKRHKMVPAGQMKYTPEWKGQTRTKNKIAHDLAAMSVLHSLETGFLNTGYFEVLDRRLDFFREKDPKSGKLFSWTKSVLPDGSAFSADTLLVIKNTNTGKVTTIFHEHERVNDNSTNIKREVLKKLQNYHANFMMKDRRFNHGTGVLLYTVTKEALVEKIFGYPEAAPLFGVLRVAFLKDAKKEPMERVWRRAVINKGRMTIVPWSPIHG